MYEVQIQVISPNVFQCLVNCRLDILCSVLSVPELPCDENILTRHTRLAYTGTNLCLVTVDGGTINMAIAFPQCNFYCLFDLIWLCLPRSESLCMLAHLVMPPRRCKRTTAGILAPVLSLK